MFLQCVTQQVVFLDELPFTTFHFEFRAEVRYPNTKLLCISLTCHLYQRPYFFATKDIKKGDLIFAEKPLAATITGKQGFSQE